MTKPMTMRPMGRSVWQGQDHGTAGAGSERRLRRAAPLLIAGVAVSGTSGSALAVNLFSILGPVGTLWIRSVLAGLILAAVGWRSFRWPTLGQGLRLAALGLALAASNLAFYEALGRIPLGVAATVEFTGPLAIAAAGIRRARDLAWPLLAAAGVALFGNPTVHLDLAGFAFALAAGAFWAAYILLSKRLVQEVGPVTTIGAAFAVSALALTLPAAGSTGPLIQPRSHGHSDGRSRPVRGAALPARAGRPADGACLNLLHPFEPRARRRRADGTGDPRTAPRPRRAPGNPAGGHRIRWSQLVYRPA